MDSKQRLPCFCLYYGANLEYFSALWWPQFPGDFSAKREEQTILPTKIIFWEKMNFGCIPGSLVSENIRSSSKINDLN
jgi:hypothetical protein